MIIEIRIGKFGDDTVLFFGKHALPLLGNGLPLPWRLFEADVAVGRHALAVHQDAHAGLMSRRIDVVKRHHIHALVFEIPQLFIQPEALVFYHSRSPFDLYMNGINLLPAYHRRE